MISGEFWNPSLHSGPSISFGAPEEDQVSIVASEEGPESSEEDNSAEQPF